jgi:hypothetical protein
MKMESLYFFVLLEFAFNEVLLVNAGYLVLSPFFDEKKLARVVYVLDN